MYSCLCVSGMYFLIFIYLFRLLWVLVEACELLVAACVWDLVPRPGLEPVSPALAGRFSTTAPPGKPHFVL